LVQISPAARVFRCFALLRHLPRPLIVFNEGRRFFGVMGAPIERTNAKNTIKNLKRLIGRKFSEAMVQEELEKFCDFECRQLENDEIGIVVKHEGSELVVSPVFAMGMFLASVVRFTEAYTGKRQPQLVCTVPGFFTDRQRRAMFDAAEMGGCHLLAVLNEATAAALDYGIYKSAKGLFDPTTPTVTMFVDFGQSSFSATIVSFTKGKLHVKGQAFDERLGGRNFDYAIAELCNKRFSEMKGGKDIRSRAKSWLKLMAAATKCKKDLSAHGVTQSRVNVESLTPEKDFRSVVTIEEFDEIAAPFLARLRPVLDGALASAGMTMADVSSVEAIGASMRIGCVKKRVAEILGLTGPQPNYGLSTTLNLDECFARGAALQCAIRSPLLAVSPFEVKDAVYHPIRIFWKQDADDAAAAAAEKEQTIVIFKGGLDTPKMRRVTFKRKSSAAVSVRAVYEDSEGRFPAGHPLDIGSATISGLPADWDPTAVGADGELLPAGDIRVNVKVDTNGLFGIANSQFMRPEPVVPEEAKEAPAAEKEAEAAPAASDAEAEVAPAQAEAEAAPAEAEAAPAEAEAATPPAAPEAAKEEPKPKKARVIRHELQVTQNVVNVARAEIEKLRKVEQAMLVKENLIRETEEARNALEAYVAHARAALPGRDHAARRCERCPRPPRAHARSSLPRAPPRYVYSIRRQVQDDHRAFIEPSIVAAYVAECDEMEEWLYTDEGFESVKAVYVDKLSALQKTGEPTRRRKKEQQKRGEAIATFTADVNEWKKLAGTDVSSACPVELSLVSPRFSPPRPSLPCGTPAHAPPPVGFSRPLQDDKYAHITDEERTRVRAHVTEAIESVMALCDESAKLADHEDPLITCADIAGRAVQVTTLCRPIMARPKPKPKKEEEPAKKVEEPAAAKDADDDAVDAAADGAMDVEEPAKVTEEDAKADGMD
jgi:heat shock protein 4